MNEIVTGKVTFGPIAVGRKIALGMLRTTPRLLIGATSRTECHLEFELGDRSRANKEMRIIERKELLEGVVIKFVHFTVDLMST